MKTSASADIEKAEPSLLSTTVSAIVLPVKQKALYSQQTPMKHKSSEPQILNVPSTRRFSLPKISPGNSDTPVSLIEQWTVQSSTLNPSFHLVID